MMVPGAIGEVPSCLLGKAGSRVIFGTLRLHDTPQPMDVSSSQSSFQKKKKIFPSLLFFFSQSKTIVAQLLSPARPNTPPLHPPSSRCIASERCLMAYILATVVYLFCWKTNLSVFNDVNFSFQHRLFHLYVAKSTIFQPLYLANRCDHGNKRQLCRAPLPPKCTAALEQPCTLSCPRL